MRRARRPFCRDLRLLNRFPRNDVPRSVTGSFAGLRGNATTSHVSKPRDLGRVVRKKHTQNGRRSRERHRALRYRGDLSRQRTGATGSSVVWPRPYHLRNANTGLLTLPEPNDV